MNLNKTFSYILPHTAIKGKTALGQTFEIAFEFGHKVLNSENANYSFGSLHQIMQKGITAYLRYNTPKNILLLGLGAGSALGILQKKLSTPYAVTAIEIDSDIINIAQQHFNLAQYKNLTTIHADANIWLNKEHLETYDLIIDDIFIDNAMPQFCLSENYIAACANLLNINGTYFRNSMNLETQAAEKYYNTLNKYFTQIELLRAKNLDNLLYLCKR